MIIIPLLGIFGVIISVIVGMIWYSPKTPMGKIHMKSMGIHSAEEAHKRMAESKSTVWKSYLGQMILSFLTSVFIAFIMMEQTGFPVSAVYGEVLLVWLCFTVPLVGQSLIWGNIDPKLKWKKFFSDSLSNLITFLVIVFVFSFLI
jgi:Protein of unknown function (DUF1761)